MSIRKLETAPLADLVEAKETPSDRGDDGWPDRLRQLIAIAGSASALAKGAGISQSGLTRYLAGGEPSRRVLVALAKAAGVRVLWLASGEGPMRQQEAGEAPRPGNLTLLPYHDLVDLCQLDATVAEKPNFTSQAFCRFWLRSNGLDGENLTVLQVRGDSMANTLKDGDIVLVDVSARTVEDDKIYLIQDSGNLLIRRLQLEVGGRLRALSDNPAHREFTVPAAELEILGRIAWRGSML